MFLVRDVKKNTIVSYFNGIRMKEKDVFTTYHMFQPKSVYLVEVKEEKKHSLRQRCALISQSFVLRLARKTTS